MNTRQRAVLFVLSLGLLWILAAAGSGVAGLEPRDDWSEPYPGVQFLQRVIPEEPNHIHALVIDLAHPDIAFEVTRPDDRGMRTSEFAERYGVQIALNAGFFNQLNHNAIGATMGGGEPWPGSTGHSSYAYIALGAGNRVEISELGERLEEPEDWMEHVVSGTPVLLRDGAISVEESDSDFARPHPRTAIGVSGDGTALIIAVVDGRWPGGSRGMTLVEMAELMSELGAHDALNLDGGGSTSLYVEAAGGLVNRPSGGVERVVSNHLGVRVAAAGEEALDDAA